MATGAKQRKPAIAMPTPNLQSILFGEGPPVPDAAPAPMPTMTADGQKIEGQIVLLPFDLLDDFEGHPFSVKVTDDWVETFTKYGQQEPGKVRPKPDGRYEIISGHRRRIGCEKGGLPGFKAVIEAMDDNDAVIAMVDCNKHRDDISPTEKARAVAMRMEAERRKAGRPPKDNSRHDGGDSKAEKETADKVGESMNMSGRSVQRLVRIDDLQPELKELIDAGKLKPTPAVELSYLTPEEQVDVAEFIKLEERTPSLSQAQQMRKMSADDKLTKEVLGEVFTKPKPQEQVEIRLKGPRLMEHFTGRETPREMEERIYKALDCLRTVEKKQDLKKKQMAR